MLDFYALSGLGLGPSERAEILSPTFITIIPYIRRSCFAISALSFRRLVLARLFQFGSS